MKNDRSQKAILKIYGQFGNTLIVISFKDRKRTMSYSGMSLYKAMAEKLRQESRGRTTFIIHSKEISLETEDDIESVRNASEAFEASFRKAVKWNGGL